MGSTLGGGGGLWWKFLSKGRQFGGGGGDSRRRRSQSSNSGHGAGTNGGAGGGSRFQFPLKQAVTAASLTLTGDSIAQLSSRWKTIPPGSDNKEVMKTLTSDHDWIRSLQMTTYGFLLYGPGSYAWYRSLDRALPKPNVTNLLLKVLLNQIVLGPCVIAVVFAWNKLWKGKLSELPAVYQKDALPTLLYGFKFWIPASLLNFWVIPLQTRVAFMSTCSIFWNFYLSSTMSKVVAGVSASNRSTAPLFIALQSNGVYAFVESNPPLSYGQVAYLISTSASAVFATVRIEILGKDSKRSAVFYSLGNANNLQYIRLDSDGHFRVYSFSNGMEQVVMDLLSDAWISLSPLDDCAYPTVCGRYGICSNRQCGCPDANYFTMLNPRSSYLGCVPTTPISCANSQLHLLVELPDIKYFSLDRVYSDESIEGCKQACLRNCSCKAAVLRFDPANNNPSRGECILPSDVLSLMNMADKSDRFTYSTFVKVQRSSLAPSPTPLAEVEVPTKPSKNRSTTSLPRILAPVLSVIFLLAGVLGLLLFRLCKNDVKPHEENEGVGSIDQMPGMPRRFSYKDLESATGNFQKRLGGGGFGSVFEGNFADGTKFAVKRLDQLGQGRKEFIAEVKTIGSIHHVNLVRLVGFCAENSHKLLVYDYMCNGSLDKWIFHPKQELILSWETRRKNILDIARGLTYLHEKCRNKIVHLDIKPENILLDEEFNAKVSDFGLARFIERDESQVITTLIGTRGYLAPEWLFNRRISEKVDVYSFGIVVLEIICGRRNLDYSQDDETEFLLHIVRRKAEEDRLFDAVDVQCVDMLLHREAVVKMIQTAICCLQGVSTRRPYMSMVVKVLESGADLESISDYSFLTMTPMDLPREGDAVSGTAPLLPITLSGPR